MQGCLQSGCTEWVGTKTPNVGEFTVCVRMSREDFKEIVGTWLTVCVFRLKAQVPETPTHFLASELSVEEQESQQLQY